MESRRGMTPACDPHGASLTGSVSTMGDLSEALDSPASPKTYCVRNGGGDGQNPAVGVLTSNLGDCLCVAGAVKATVGRTPSTPLWRSGT